MGGRPGEWWGERAETERRPVGGGERTALVSIHRSDLGSLDSRWSEKDLFRSSI